MKNQTYFHPEKHKIFQTQFTERN